MRLDGNSVLIADAGYGFSGQPKTSLAQLGAKCFHADDLNEVKSLLGKHDFDVIIIFSGFVEIHGSNGTKSKINKAYIQNWNKLRNYHDHKQVKITRFLKKASGR